jgi:hypothetical protein|eukprot:COSAG01_NODE_3007_length_6730_cov_10.756899_10_plen_83_part_00
MQWANFSDQGEVPDPGCKGGLTTWAKGGALVLANSASQTKRVNVTVRLSFDGGATWPKSQLVSGMGGYTSKPKTHPTLTNKY